MRLTTRNETDNIVEILDDLHLLDSDARTASQTINDALRPLREQLRGHWLSIVQSAREKQVSSVRWVRGKQDSSVRWTRDKQESSVRWALEKIDGVSVWWRAGAEKRSETQREVRRVLLLAGWAPTAVIGALLGAGLIASVSAWILNQWWGYSDGTGRTLTIGVGSASLVGLLLWFATEPKTATSVKQFWSLVQLLVIVLGVVGGILAVVAMVNLFR